MKWISLVPSLLLLLVAGSGCNRNAASAPVNELPTVEVSLPETGTISDSEVFTGRTWSFGHVDLKARVTGYLDRVYVGEDANVPVKERIKEGTDVRKGQTLFVLDREPFEAALQQAKANREQAAKTIIQQEATRVMQEEQARYNRASYERYRLAGVGSTPDDIDKAYSGWKTAESGAKAAEAAKEAAQASERGFKAAEEIAQKNLNWATIKAPLDGRIGKRMVDLGNVVKADDTILASVEQLDPLGAYFDVDERTLLKIGHLFPGGKIPEDSAQRFPLKLGFSNEKPEDFKHQGILKIADNRVDPNTGTLRLYGAFDNSDFNLKSGMFVRVQMGVGLERPALFVAEAALGSDQGRKFLYVVDDENKIARVIVEVGQRKNGLIAIEAGLTGNEKIVVNGLQRVRAKLEVQTKMVKMPRATTAVTTLPLAPVKK